MRRISWTFGICAWVTLAAAVQPAWGVLNNGFETDYVYALRETGDLRAWNETTGVAVTPDLIVAASPIWSSLTFAGVGSGDARLFLVRQTATRDIELAEIDAGGTMLHSNTLSAIMGVSAPLSANLAVGTIRFSRGRPDSLFVSASSDITGTSRGMAWEIDLGLSTLKNTYTGPFNPLAGAVDVQYRAVYVDVAPDGTLYMVGQHLGQPTSDDGLGDLVSFDTSGGSTSTYTTLIDGPTYNPPAVGEGDDRWDKPSGVAYRRANPGDGTPTIQIGQQNSANARAVLEFYLDTTAHPVDANGNLIYRGTQISIRRAYMGQQDELTGSVWWAGVRQGIHEIKADDSIFRIDNVNGHNWMDVDSPSSTIPLAPVILPATPNPAFTDPAFPDVEYVKQLSLGQGSPPVTWSLLQGPEGAVIDQTGRISGRTPSWDDVGRTFTFEARAINSVGADTELWQAEVHPLNNGFVGDYVYVITESDGRIRILDEATGRDMGEFAATQADLDSLTFTGAGKDDTRLFVGKPSGTSEVTIAEIDASGAVVRSLGLSTLAGPLGTAGSTLQLGNVRFSNYYPDSLFVSAVSDASGSLRGMAWELNLALDTLKNTYTGPPVPAPSADSLRYVGVDINDNDGTIYMTGQHLNRPTDDNLGDLVKFTSTSTFAVLVNGETYSTGDPDYGSPRAPIFRSSNPTDGTPTLVIPMNIALSGNYALEFYLDTAAHPVDADGNLALRGNPISLKRGALGQEDVTTGDIWIGAIRGGVHAIRSDGTTTSHQTGTNWKDAARPPFKACNDPSADFDGDGDVDQADFAAFQICHSPQAPSDGLGAVCSCFDRGDDNDDGTPDRDGDIDGFDFTAFVSCASGPSIAADPDCGG